MVKLSIVVVAFRNMECLSACLASIPLLPWIEVIVVNNSHQNRGFSAGCNMGARIATGEYLLFLNPDCVVDEKALTRLVTILDKDKTIGIVGPQLTDIKGNAYLSCNQPLSRAASPLVYSFLGRILRQIPLVRNYWFGYKPPSDVVEVGSVCGAAMGMRKKIFDSVHGFDERFFLYWEEFDLAIRVSKKGYRIVFDPTVSLIHEGELSTTQPKQQVLRWFRESRYYFFTKHFGRLYAILLEGWLTFFEEWRYILGVVITLGFGLWFYRFGWWLGISYFPYWERWISLGLPTLSTGYWLGVGGALFFMTMVYNELKLSRWVTFFITVLAGIGAVALSLLGPFLLALGGVWMIADLQRNLLWLRKGLVTISVAAVVFASGFLSWQIVNSREYSASLSEWNEITGLLNKSGKTISIQCIGCASDRDLKPLQRLLFERGVRVAPSAQKTVYLFLPPISLNKHLLPDALTVRAGNMVLAWPLTSL